MLTHAGKPCCQKSPIESWVCLILTATVPFDYIIQLLFCSTDDVAPATNHLVKLAQLTNDMHSTQQLNCLSVENMEQVSHCPFYLFIVHEC